MIGGRFSISSTVNKTTYLYLRMFVRLCMRVCVYTYLDAVRCVQDYLREEQIRM